MTSIHDMNPEEAHRHDAVCSLAASFKQQDISRKLNELTQKEPKIAFALEDYINELLRLKYESTFLQGRAHERKLLADEAKKALEANVPAIEESSQPESPSEPL